MTHSLLLLIAFSDPHVVVENPSPQPVVVQRRTIRVPQQLYQEYEQQITIKPGRRYTVPYRTPAPYYYRRMPRGVWGWGPFPMGYYY